MATGWTVRGSNPGGGEIFRTCPDRPWGPPSLLYNGYQVFPRGKERPGRDADPLPPSSAVGHERVELYLYSPYGPYGLYRASVPLQGCTLHLLFTLLFYGLHSPTCFGLIYLHGHSITKENKVYVNFRLPPRCKSDLHSSGMLRRVN